MTSKRALCASLAIGLVCGACGGSSGGDLESPTGVETPSSGRSGAGGNDDAEGTGSAGRGNGAGARPGSGTSGSNTGTSGAVSTTPDEDADATVSAGCGQEPEFQSGTQELEVGGLTRTFILDLPSGYDSDVPYPILFGFHGRDFTSADFRSASYGNLLSAAGDDAIVVHPDATATGAWELEGDQDVEFFDALLATLSDGLCVNRARVFATGHSSGGYFTNVLGCRRANVLRAIAPVAGGPPTGSDGDAPACEGPISAMIVHGEEDAIVPFVNGESSLDYWLGSDECDADSAEPVDPEPCVAYGGCADGTAVRWCAYAGGHDWPSFAARGIWDFFSSR